MTGRAELAVGAGLGKLAEKVFVHVALDVYAFMGCKVHLVDALNSGAKRGPVVDLEGGTVKEELTCLREARQVMEILDGVTNGS